jgi:HSP20 family protein
LFKGEKMTNDLIPKKFFAFPSLSFPDIFEDDDWLSTSSEKSGLSVYEDGNKVYVEAAIPGIDPKDIEVTFQDKYLWVRGETKKEEEDKKKKYYSKAVSSFNYRVALPGDVDAGKEPEATYKNGVMKIAFVKSPKVQPKKIQVKTE